MEAYIADWLNTILRFAHFVTGIAWIGASFYFNALENNLNRRPGQRAGIAGHLWAVHGGGFYYLEKYKIYPDKLPQQLHWFKWEAYFTLLTGLGLLGVVYYYNATSYLLKAGSDLSAAAGIIASVAGLVAGWLIYHTISKTKLVQHQRLVALIMLGVVFLAAAVYNEIFTPRAVFYQVGAMIGTIMVLNVFFVIMPSQRALVKACTDKETIGEDVGFRGYIRSRNNNYFTLPVLFIMLSAHFPMFYSNGLYAPLMLVLIFIVTVLIRHYFNLAGEKKPGGAVALAVAGAITVATFVALMPAAPKAAPDAQPVAFETVQTIVAQRCATCHSSHPTDDVFRVAPSGFVLDTGAQIVAAKEAIYARTVASDSMPFANKTRMTPEERALLSAWAVNQQK